MINFSSDPRGCQILRAPDDCQTPFDAAIIMTSLLRPSLPRAVQSVFQQDFQGRIHILIGIDVAHGDRQMLIPLTEACPDRMMITLFDLGYSTSQRHGGLYPNYFGGSLRTVMSYAANSRYLAYLDDDNWLAPNHLSSLRAAIKDHGFAWSNRWMVEPGIELPICIDQWESVGFDAGLFNETQGGFIDTSSLMLDKLACHGLLPLWSLAALANGGGEDRLIFAALRQGREKGLTGRGTGLATCYYRLQPEDDMNPIRQHLFAVNGIQLPSARARAPATVSAPDQTAS